MHIRHCHDAVDWRREDNCSYHRAFHLATFTRGSVSVVTIENVKKKPQVVTDGLKT